MNLHPFQVRTPIVLPALLKVLFSRYDTFSLQEHCAPGSYCLQQVPPCRAHALPGNQTGGETTVASGLPAQGRPAEAGGGGVVGD